MYFYVHIRVLDHQKREHTRIKVDVILASYAAHPIDYKKNVRIDATETKYLRKSILVRKSGHGSIFRSRDSARCRLQ